LHTFFCSTSAEIPIQADTQLKLKVSSASGQSHTSCFRGHGHLALDSARRRCQGNNNFTYDATAGQQPLPMTTQHYLLQS